MTRIQSNLTDIRETAPDVVTASDDYASRFSGAIGKYFLDVQEEITLKLLYDLHHPKVLDVGGGHGQLALPLVERGYHVTVTGSTNECRTQLGPNLRTDRLKYVTCSFFSLPFDNKEFDVVMAFRLLPHVKDWKRLIREMCRVSKRAVILDYPDKRSSNLLYDAFFSFKKKLEGNTRTFFLFTRRDVACELEENNFDPKVFKPEFFLPMVVHRTLKSVMISKTMEALARNLGLTSVFGSPIIVRGDGIS